MTLVLRICDRRAQGENIKENLRVSDKLLVPTGFLDLVKRYLNIYGISALCLVGTTITAGATTSSIPPGYEAYSSRPDVLKMEPKSSQHLAANWAKYKRGHLEAVAMLLEMYPDHEIYFLARDAEYLFDFARLATRRQPAVQKRLHLLNVSRTHMKDPSLNAYLAQEGISEESLAIGRKVLLVDTGYTGSIPRGISALYSEKARSRLKAHLMSSSNVADDAEDESWDIPSFRGFFAALYPAAPVLQPGTLHRAIESYENNLPHFTNSSGSYIEINGKWEALSKKGNSIHDQADASEHMKDLAAYVANPKTMALLEERRLQWRRLRELSTASKNGRAALVKELQGLLRKHKKDPFIESMVRDYLELREIHHPEWPAVLYNDLGLSPPAHRRFNEALIGHPEWAPLLVDPKAGVSRMVEAGEFESLWAITKTIADQEFTEIVFKTIGERRPTAKTRNFVRGLINESHRSGRYEVLKHTFSEPKSTEMKELLALMITKADGWTLTDIKEQTLSLPHWKGPEFDILRQATAIKGPRERANFLSNHFGSLDDATCAPKGLRGILARFQQNSKSK